MCEIIWMLIFFITAFFYSASGLGGASAYLAYFSLMNVEYTRIPPTALFLSAISTFTSTINWIRGRNLSKNSIPFLLFSVPAAFLGGKMRLSEQIFNLILIITLLVVGFLMIKPENKNKEDNKINSRSGDKITNKIILALPISSVIGFISGMIGIGGGVFLIPVIYAMGIMDYKSASSTGAIFIFFNSIFGLFGQITKQPPDIRLILKFSIPVILGAFLGSFLSSRKFSASLVKKIFGGVVIFIAMIKLAETMIAKLMR